MNYTLPAVITALVCFTAAFSHASHQKKIKAVPVVLENPCNGDFKLRVVVTPVEGTDNWPIGFSLELKKGAKRGIASRTQTEQNAEFTDAACQQWQQRNWQLLDRILYENNRPERKKLVCRKIASISYTLGSKSQRANVCLGTVKHDSVAHAFKTFFEASDGLVR